MRGMFPMMAILEDIFEDILIIFTITLVILLYIQRNGINLLYYLPAALCLPYTSFI